eukprot:gene699-757_t
MLLIPQDLALIGYCIYIPALFEFIRIILGYLLGGPSKKVAQLEAEKLLLLIEQRKIKSVQLELVKHSKLERKIIKIDKEIEKINSENGPKVTKTRKILRYLRAVFYLIACIYFSTVSVLLISPEVFWPFSWISSEKVVSVHAWFLVLVAGAACRHLFRTLLPLVAYPSSFP